MPNEKKTDSLVRLEDITGLINAYAERVEALNWELQRDIEKAMKLAQQFGAARARQWLLAQTASVKDQASY